MFAVTINFIIIALGNARFIKFLIYVDLKIWRTFRKVVIFLGYVSELYNNKIARKVGISMQITMTTRTQSLILFQLRRTNSRLTNNVVLTPHMVHTGIWCWCVMSLRTFRIL